MYCAAVRAFVVEVNTSLNAAMGRQSGRLHTPVGGSSSVCARRHNFLHNFFLSSITDFWQVSMLSMWFVHGHTFVHCYRRALDL